MVSLFHWIKLLSFLRMKLNEIIFTTSATIFIFILLLSDNCIASTGVSSLNSLFTLIFILIFIVVFIALVVTYFVYRKYKNKWHWLIVPVGIIVIGLLVIGFTFLSCGDIGLRC